MEKTIENKAKFFAHYLNQKVLLLSETDKGTLLTFLFLDEEDLPRYKLNLKPLSSISDEDAIAVSKLCVHGNDVRIENIKEYARIYAMKSALINDYLRSKGYALPWMGLSVDQLINYGWIKLKSE